MKLLLYVVYADQVVKGEVDSPKWKQVDWPIVPRGEELVIIDDVSVEVRTVWHDMERGVPFVCIDLLENQFIEWQLLTPAKGWSQDCNIPKLP